jgi:hypothetical protein
VAAEFVLRCRTHVPGWSSAQLQVKPLSGGMSNTLFLVTRTSAVATTTTASAPASQPHAPSEIGGVIVRVFGHAMNVLLDAQTERVVCASLLPCLNA